MHDLIAGIQHFQTNVFPVQRELFEQLGQGQSPPALFVTCSDSRISPNLITQARPGQLFMLRNAGNIIPPYPSAFASGEAAAIEFAVVALGVRNIIVCGHSGCAAVGALLDPEAAHGLPALQAWLMHATATRRAIDDALRHLPADARLAAAIETHVRVQLEQLATHPSVAERLANGQVTLHGWVYTLETGAVVTYHPDRGTFVPLAAAAGEEPLQGEHPGAIGQDGLSTIT